MQGFERKAGHLLVDGLSVSELADQFGTPSYVYSGAQLLANYRQFAKAVSGLDGQIHFAVMQHGAGAEVEQILPLPMVLGQVSFP